MDGCLTKGGEKRKKAAMIKIRLCQIIGAGKSLSIYLCTVLKYNFEVLVNYFSISTFFYFMTFQRQILYFLLHYIYLIPLVTS